jgi:hypothetical protein
MVANYYKPGPGTASGVRAEIASPSARRAGDEGHWHVSANVVEGSDAVTSDNWRGLTSSK